MGPEEEREEQADSTADLVRHPANEFLCKHNAECQQQQECQSTDELAEGQVKSNSRSQNFKFRTEFRSF